MRIKIRLDGRKNSRTPEGFPVIFYLTKGSEKEVRTGYFSEKRDWDKANALPKKTHPQYAELINYLALKKIKIAEILQKDRLSPLTIDRAEAILLSRETGVFYNDGLLVASNRAHQIALRSFNGYFPGYTFNEITPSIAKQYMNKLLTTPTRNNQRPRSPNGVRSYMNSLTAIWNKLERSNNPFSGIRPPKVKTKSKALTDQDLMLIINNPYKNHPNSKGGGKANYLNYLLLCFYLGGIDLGDLVRLRYDRHVINNRIEFNRSKGGTSVLVSNRIFPQAWQILKKYDCKPHLIPLHSQYGNFIPNISRQYRTIQDQLGLSKPPFSKSARYTFITRAQNLLIDERIVVQLVGHSQNTIHSVYKDEFPHHVIDQAHAKIIAVKP